MQLTSLIFRAFLLTFFFFIFSHQSAGQTQHRWVNIEIGFLKPTQEFYGNGIRLKSFVNIPIKQDQISVGGGFDKFSDLMQNTFPLSLSYRLGTKSIFKPFGEIGYAISLDPSFVNGAFYSLGTKIRIYNALLSLHYSHQALPKAGAISSLGISVVLEI